MSERDPGKHTSALDWAVAHGRAADLVEELHRRARRRHRRRQVLSGFAALLVMATAWQHWPGPARPSPGGRSALVLEPIRHTLPDGSRVELREGAEYVVEFTPEARRLTLSRGEGHFTVQKDPARPFIVAAGGLEVRAVGTAFSVQVDARDVAVLVTAGRVALERPELSSAVGPAVGPAPAPLALLDAGTHALVARHAAGDLPAPPRPQVTSLNDREIGERLHWRAPRLELSGTRLGEALHLFNQHSPRRLSLGDPRLAELQVSGLVRADNADALVRLLQANYGVTARETGPGELILELSR